MQSSDRDHPHLKPYYTLSVLSSLFFIAPLTAVDYIAVRLHLETVIGG
jgi:hypothetical protein